MADEPIETADDVDSIIYRLEPSENGYDMRAERVVLFINKAEFVRASYADEHGRVRVVSGSLDTVVSRLRAVGYLVQVAEADEY
jgi:hypothetical protein